MIPCYVTFFVRLGSILKKIVFLTTSYRDTGPTQQLFNIISRLNRKRFKPILISLTDPVRHDRFKCFEELSIDTYSLGINKASAILSLGRIKKLIIMLDPHLIHSHGLVPDLLVVISRLSVPHVLTIRNDPYLDYPTKFGRIRGTVMAYFHVLAIRACPAAIACSDALQRTFLKYGVNAKMVRNGVDPSFIETDFIEEFLDPKISRFITAGSLIPRKNIEFMVSVFGCNELRSRANFLILGDGFLRSKCQQLSGDNISMAGHVDKPYRFLSSSQYYISLSKSEGMPNSVIEALMVGLPCVLSNIGPHKEIYNLMPNYIYLVDCSNDARAIAADISLWLDSLGSFDNQYIRSRAIEEFHADATYLKYQKIYLDQIGSRNV